MVKLHDCMVISFESVSVCNRRTDRRTRMDSHAAYACHALASACDRHTDRQTDRWTVMLPMPMSNSGIAKLDKKYMCYIISTYSSFW